MIDNKFGFIITRHVNSEKTNKYWNNNVKLLRRLYPRQKIVIIDDNSNYDYVKPEFEYSNVEIVQSEFPGRGELLPYYYFLKNRFFENAVIIHDSVFFHKRINFDKLSGIDVMPFWFFHLDEENIMNTKRILGHMRNNMCVEYSLIKNNNILGMPYNKCYGCFGVQSYINLQFLERIEQKYKITNLIQAVKCRADRCCLERIFGAIFFTESPRLCKQKSLFGNIMKYQKWGYTYDEYMEHIRSGKLPKYVVKVWTGR